MAYKKLALGKIQHTEIRDVIQHANNYLEDTYGMFYLPIKGKGGGGCNFSIALVLLSVIDGIASEIYPTRQVKKQDVRFKRLIREKLYWVPSSKEWINKDDAAQQLYVEFRNPLVHELAAKDRGNRSSGKFEEPVISKWGLIEDSEQQDIAKIDNRKVWNDAWPTVYKDPANKDRLILSCASLYWSVKRLIEDLISDQSVMDEARKYQDSK